MRLPRALSPRDHGSPWGLFAWEQVEQVKPLTGRRHCCAQCAHRTAAGKDERTDMGKPRSTVPCAPGRGCRTRPLQPPCSGRSASPPQGRQQTVTTTQGQPRPPPQGTKTVAELVSVPVPDHASVVPRPAAPGKLEMQILRPTPDPLNPTLRAWH